MAKIYLAFALSLLLCTAANQAGAQCTGGTSEGTITPTTSWQTITTKSNYYYQFSAIAGNVYTFSYCPCVGGSMTYSAEITIDSNASASVVNGDYTWTNYNNAYCDDANDAPQVTWQCTASGTYEVLTTEQFCSATSGLTATMAYKMETPSICYSVSSTVYSPDTYNTGTKPSGMKVDDGISKAIAIGFSFCFNGTYYDSLFISSNGYVTFIGSCPIVPMDTINSFPASSYTMETLPFTNTTYTPFIGPGVLFPWIDAYPIGGGNIYYKLYGTAPNRHLTVSYYNVDMFSCNTKKITTEVQLYETTNNIEIQSKNIPQCAAWTPPGGQGVEGVVDETGFAAVVPPGRNLTSWTATNEAWLFTPSCCSVLPIKLLNFQCNSQNNGIMLNWSTASEINNKYFTVERSVDGITFTPIAQIPGADNSDDTKYYSYLDTTAPNGVSYYKLRQTDIDGNNTESYVSSCSLQRMLAGDVFPNPSNGSFTVTLGPSQQTTVVTITDVIGRTVYTQQFPPSAVYIDQAITVPNLKGVYLLRITNGQQPIVKKLLLK